MSNMAIVRGVSGALVVAALAVAAPARAQCGTTDCAPCSGGELIVWHAGSLNTAFRAAQSDFSCSTGVTVVERAAGSLDLGRQLANGGVADIYAPADYLDIDLFLRPGGFADYDVLFAQGKMVLGYTTSSLGADQIAGPGTFNPPDSVPDAVSDWYSILTQPGVMVGSSHLYLDPSGYRAPMFFRLSSDYYHLPDLYAQLLEHHLALPAAATAGTFGLKGTSATAQYDYQYIYEHSAQASARSNPDYRYVNLPDALNLGRADLNDFYRHSAIVEPGVPGTAPYVPIPATKVIWGVTILKDAPHRDTAIRFLQLLLSPEGLAKYFASGPAPIQPPLVSDRDYRNLPRSLRALVKPGPVFTPPRRGFTPDD